MSDFKDFKEAVDGLVGKLDKHKEDLEAKIKAASDEKAEELKGLKDSFEAIKDQVKELKALEGSLKSNKDKESFKDIVYKGIKEASDNLERLASGTLSSFKYSVPSDFIDKAVADMTAAGHLTGNIQYTYRGGDIVGIPYKMPHVREIIRVTPSNTDSYHYYRHIGGEGDLDWQGTEGAAKAAFDEDLAERVAVLDYLAGLLTITRQLLRNIPALQAYLNNWLPEKYLRAEDKKFKAFAIAQAGNMTTGDTTGTGSIERIIKTVAILQGLGYNVNRVAIAAAVWSRIMLNKSATSGEYTLPAGVTISDSGDIRVMGIPLSVVSWLDDDKALIGDYTQAEIIQSEGISVRYSEEHSTNFAANKITVRVEASIAFTLLAPKAFSYIDLGEVA